MIRFSSEALVAGHFLKRECDETCRWTCPDCGSATGPPTASGASCPACPDLVSPHGRCGRCGDSVSSGEKPRACCSQAVYERTGIIAFRQDMSLWEVTEPGRPVRVVSDVELRVIAEVAARGKRNPTDASRVMVREEHMREAIPLSMTEPFRAVRAASPPPVPTPLGSSHGDDRGVLIVLGLLIFFSAFGYRLLRVPTDVAVSQPASTQPPPASRSPIPPSAPMLAALPPPAPLVTSVPDSTGTVKISTAYPASIRMVDGELVHVFELKESGVISLPPGRYNLFASSPNVLLSERALGIVHLAAGQVVELALPKVVSLSVHGLPISCRIWIGAVEVENSSTLNVAAGTVPLRFSWLSGEEKAFDVAVDRDLSVTMGPDWAAPTVAPWDGTTYGRVESGAPPQQPVRVGGGVSTSAQPVPRPATPRVASPSPVGTLDIAPPRLLSVDVYGVPGNCKIWVDGREIRNRESVSIAPGSHSFRFLWPTGAHREFETSIAASVSISMGPEWTEPKIKTTGK